MFEDSLLESGDRFKHEKRRGKTTLAALAMQVVLVGMILVLPLYFTEKLPEQRMLAVLVAPPPPPPPPAAAASAPAPKVVKPVQSNIERGVLHTPTKIPDRVQVVQEEAPPAPTVSANGVVGGVPGGVPGGQLGGALGGVINSVAAPVVVEKPKITTPQRVRVSQGILEGSLLHKVAPVYPLLARQAHMQGAVVLQAVIAKDGSIEKLQVIQGQTLLTDAAVEAVKKWKYKPYLLNGEPVEVETTITVNFTFSRG